MKGTTRLIATLAAGLLGSIAHAATVTLCGPTICYEYDDAQPAVDLYGQPHLVGDGLRFLPVSFLALSANGDGVSVANATFQLDRVWTPGGQNIIALEFRESGDLKIVQDGNVTADLFVQVTSNVDLLDFTTDTAALDISGPSGGVQEWVLASSIDPSMALSGPANDFALLIQNFITASTSENGELAWIQKKFALELAAIPLPATVWLFVSALGLLAWRMPRRG